MDKSKPSSPLRVLIRPSSATPTTTTTTTTTTSATPSTNPLDLPLSALIRPYSSYSSSSSSSLVSSSSSSSQSRSPEGVVVVGFIGKREEDVSQLVNRVLDHNVFGSGNLDKRFPKPQSRNHGEEGEEEKDWFRSRRISYYYEEEKEIVFLQFVSTRCAMKEDFDSSSELDTVLDEHESGDLQGMLLMFSVCHVIIYLQEGSRFDTQILKKFRMLQSAKHSLVPFMKSHIKPTSNSRVSSSFTSQPTASATPSNRHPSAISLMSGLGSYSSLFPGQCIPVVLFVFLDDFPESPSVGSNVEESADTTPLNQSLNMSGLPRPCLPVKGSSSVVVLSRPVSKSESGARKKLQSSLEAQIRFLMKKCRTLASSEVSHAGSRGGGNGNSAPLFSLEASKAVALLDISTNQKGESLDFAVGLLDEILSGKTTSDSLLLETHYQGGNKEDIQSIKDFIYRQADTLRGKGGALTNTNGGSAAGVGMVAVAAAAAAASAASGKPLNTPELPSLDNWLSSSGLILDALFYGTYGCLDETEVTQLSKRPSVRRNAASTKLERIVPSGIDPVQGAISWLEIGKGLNKKFSTTWSNRVLPFAKEIYLKELPSCYPTSMHEVQLEKAMHAFHSMVKGPAVKSFAKRLEDECTSIWRSGRQLCDSVSLTGKPCMHQRHNIEEGGTLSGTEFKPHSSGFVFLHACACGRSRRLRDDPFDFETANISFNRFENCDSVLPALQLPEVSNIGPITSASWSVLRVGGARYYEPSKGLLQSGFSPTEKFLQKWTIFLRKQTETCNRIESTTEEVSEIIPNQDPLVVSKEIKQRGVDQSLPREANSWSSENQRKRLVNMPFEDKKSSSGKGPSHFPMKKPFSEVVAGSIATDVAFPPLQQRKQPTGISEKSVKQKVSRDRSDEHARITMAGQGPFQSENKLYSQETTHMVGDNAGTDGELLLQIGSYVVPMNSNAGGKIKLDNDLKHEVVYFGFEHECSYGHRYLLTSEHLDELGSLYSFTQDSYSDSCMKKVDNKAIEMLNSNKNSPRSNVMMTTSVSKMGKSRRPNQKVNNHIQHRDRSKSFSGSGKEQNQISSGLSLSNSVDDLQTGLDHATLDDAANPVSLLNRNLPLYMNCPHCRTSKSTYNQQKIKFASTVSQLQRIFVVTPSFPVVLATSPIVQFEASVLPPSVPDCERQSQFSIGCQVILPPDSFVTIRLPFVYGVQLEDGSLHPLYHLQHQPELTAWITNGTALQFVSNGGNLPEEIQT